MKIIIAALEFESLTGAPMYHYNLSKGLRELGHDIVCVGIRVGGEIKEMLNAIGVPVYDMADMERWAGEYDIIIIAEHLPEYLDVINAPKIFNLSHSKNFLDRPIKDERIVNLAPREQVAEYWEEEFKILPIPIDFDRFNGKEKTDEYTILVPCTLDEQRKPMLLDLLKRKEKVIIVGQNYGALNGIEIPDNVTILPQNRYIEGLMRKADEVAGLHIGTVTIEAWAMGLKTSVYDEKGNWEYVDKPKDFDKYNYKNVAKQLIQL